MTSRLHRHKFLVRLSLDKAYLNPGAVDRLGLDLGAHRVTISVMLMKSGRKPSGEPSRGVRDAFAYLLIAIGVTILVAFLVAAV